MDGNTYVGVHYEYSTLVIPQHSDSTVLPGPWQMSDPTQDQRRAGSVAGVSQFETIFVFDETVTGHYIKTQYYGTGLAGTYWNQNNTDGDTNLKAVLCAHAHDFAIFGAAEFRPYPMTYNESWTEPDVHGPDMPYVANGISMQGSGNRVERVRLFNIPGTGVIMRPGTGSQAGFYGMWDEAYTILNDVRVTQAINGIDVSNTDAKIRGLYVDNVSQKGAILDLNGGYLSDAHICGADIGLDVISELHASEIYVESARIGTHLRSNAHGCSLHDLNIGPGTCRETGLLIESNGNDVRVIGGVGYPGYEHDPATGVINSGHTNDLKVGLRVEDDGDCAVRLTGGNGGTLDLGTFHPTSTSGTALHITGAINHWEIKIRCQGASNPVALDVDDIGVGNVIRIITMDGPVQVLGDIGEDNELWIDGVQQ